MPLDGSLNYTFCNDWRLKICYVSNFHRNRFETCQNAVTFEFIIVIWFKRFIFIYCYSEFTVTRSLPLIYRQSEFTFARIIH